LNWADYGVSGYRGEQAKIDLDEVVGAETVEMVELIKTAYDIERVLQAIAFLFHVTSLMTATATFASFSCLLLRVTRCAGDMYMSQCTVPTQNEHRRHTGC